MLGIIPTNLKVKVYPIIGEDDGFNEPSYSEDYRELPLFTCPNTKEEVIVDGGGNYITFEATLIFNGLEHFNIKDKIVWIDEGGNKLEKTVIALPQYVRDFAGKVLFTRVRV